jgi:dolichyl-phosphate-mannose-protein mannosyltransferase
MSRQLFIHHYLPSHIASALIAGAVLHYVLCDTVNYPISVRGPKTRARPAQYADLGLKAPIIVVVFALLMLITFAYMAPLTYGTPGQVVIMLFAA